MRQFFIIIFLFLSVPISYANDDLPQNYTPNNINPYKSRFRVSYDRSPEFDKYDFMLSRLEREWFGKDYSKMLLADRLNRLEEHVFGTSFNEAVEERCERLKRAFNAKKQNYQTNNLFLGMPTSIPMNIDGLVE